MILDKKIAYISILFSLFCLCFENTKIKTMEIDDSDDKEEEGRGRSLSISPNKLNKAIQKAAELGYLNLASGLMKKKTDPEDKRKSNIQEKMIIDLTNLEDFTRGLKAAALTGDIKLLKHLLKYFEPKQFLKEKNKNEVKEILDEMSDAANNTLKFAALGGETDAVKCLLSEPKITYRLTPKGIKEALSFSASNNHIETVSTLIKFIIDDYYPLHKENITDPALCSACSKGYYEIVEILLNNTTIRNSFSVGNIRNSKDIAKISYEKAKDELKELKNKIDNLKKILTTLSKIKI